MKKTDEILESLDLNHAAMHREVSLYSEAAAEIRLLVATLKDVQEARVRAAEEGSAWKGESLVLKEIVSHLPHTKDGHPIYPGRKVWVIVDDEDEDEAWQGWETVQDIESPPLHHKPYLLSGNMGEFYDFQCYAEPPNGLS